MTEKKESQTPKNLLDFPENANYKLAIEEFLLFHREEVEKCLPETWCEKCANSQPKKVEDEVWDTSALKKSRVKQTQRGKSSERKGKRIHIEKGEVKRDVGSKNTVPKSVRCDQAENCWIHLSGDLIGRKGKNKYIGTVCKSSPRGCHPALEQMIGYMDNYKRGFIPVVICYKDHTYDVVLAKLPW